MSTLPAEVLFDEDKCTLLLSLPKFSIPKYAEEHALADGLERKKEFHITIFGFSSGFRINKKLSALEKGERDAILKKIKNLAEETPWSINFTDKIYKVRKLYRHQDKPEESRESYIQMILLKGLEEFISQAADLLSMRLETPVPHITLFSKSSLPENMLSGIGIASEEELQKLRPIPVRPLLDKGNKYKVIALPTRAQPDTIVAIFILKKFGEEFFKNISKAEYKVLARIPEGETEESLAKSGTLLIDVGNGLFDHHGMPIQTTASALIAEYLGVKNNPALTKLLQFAERDDFYGKGTLSTDPLDRAFGFSGLVAALNKKYVNDPGRVIEIALPLLDAFYAEEEKRAFEMPQELKEKLERGKAHTFEVRQRGKILKCIFIETDNASMAGYLRSKIGGGFDVVAIRLSSGHVNILTKPVTRPDLQSLMVLIRLQEADKRGVRLPEDPNYLAKTGTIPEVPEWYFDPATNSLLNGGPNPEGISPTAIEQFEFQKTLEVGLSEQLWKPT